MDTAPPAADWKSPTVATSTTTVVRPSRQWRSGYARKLVVGDTIVVVFAVGVAYWLRFNVLPVTGYAVLDYPVVSSLVIIGWLLALAVCRTRSPRVVGEGAEEYRRVVVATLSVFSGIAIVSMLLKLEIARGYLAIALPLGIVGLILCRMIARRFVVTARRKHGAYVTPVVAVGDVRAVRGLAQSMARMGESGYEVVGACITGGYSRDVLEIPKVGQIPVYGNEKSVVRAVEQTSADTVALTATEHLGPGGIRDLSWDLEKLDVDLVISPGMADVAGPRLMMRPVAGLPLIHVEKPQYNGTKRFEKRAFDVIFSLFVLTVTAPLLLLIAIAIKLTSPGPVFYLSERIGLDGKPFRMIKFRTMVVDADKQVDDLADLNESVGGVLFKMRDDPRVTSLGRVLRRYSLDEIPQFINVVLRDMSVVGPRPPLLREVESYDHEVKRRLLVRPGITGLWQVSGRSDLSWEESVRLDLFYVENWSMTSDLVIVTKTFHAMLGHSGAY
ncbi:hypothetical protein EB75_14475 [Mycobacterium sp. ST-F2]|nr:hypothetical protein EB75_14475 [Mycobacterium sp. ST-F2]